MEEENYNYLDITEFIREIRKFPYRQPLELKIGYKILKDLNIDPERDDDINIHCSSADFHNFLARIIMTTLNFQKT